MIMLERGPHQGEPVFTTGKPLNKAAAAMILIHGRGANAANILELAHELDYPDLAYLAPQAAGFTWWPQSFLAPLAYNEPWFSSALTAVDDLIQQIREAGFSQEKIFIGGFSQGAILTAEYAARRAQRYAGLFIFSGGLFGPPGMPRNYAGSLENTPVYIGCSDIDPHIPLARVEETADVFTKLGAEVHKQIFPNTGHKIVQEEIDQVRHILEIFTLSK